MLHVTFPVTRFSEDKHRNLIFDKTHQFETTGTNKKQMSEHNMKVRKLCLNTSFAYLDVLYYPSISVAEAQKSRHKLGK